jgi:hypothetical protein
MDTRDGLEGKQFKKRGEDKFTNIYTKVSPANAHVINYY